MSGGGSRWPRRLLAGVLAAALILLSPGLEGWQAFAAGVPKNSRLACGTSSRAPVSAGGGPSLSRVPELGLRVPGADFSRFGAALPPSVAAPTFVSLEAAALDWARSRAFTAADRERPLAKRLAAVRELRNDGGPRALAALAALGRAGTPAASAAAARSFDGSELSRHEAVAADPAAPFAERVAAARALLRDGGSKAHEALERVGGGLADYEVARQALRALAHHGRARSLPPLNPRQAAELLERRPDAVVFGPGTWKADEAGSAAVRDLSVSGVETTVADRWKAVLRLPPEVRASVSAVSRGRLLAFDRAGAAHELSRASVGSPLEAAVHAARAGRETLVRWRGAFAHLPARWFAAAKRALGLLPAPKLAAAQTWAVSAEGRATAGAGITLSIAGFADPREDGVILWPGKGREAGVDVARAIARPQPSAVDKKAVAGLFVARTLSIIAFVGTTLAYPFIAKSVLGVGPDGEALYATVVALGQLGSIVAGPMSGWLSRRYSPRAVMTINVVLRLLLALELPVFWALGWLNFATLLIGSFANYFVLTSITTTESTYIKKFAGTKNLATANSLLQINYFAIQVLLGLIAGVGAWIDALRGLGMQYSMIPFWISAGLHAAILGLFAVFRWIPDDSPQAPARFRSAESRARSLKRLGVYLYRHGWEATLLAAAIVSFFFFHSALPIAGAMTLWIARSRAGQQILAHKPMRNSLILLACGAAMLMPLQYFILQAMAAALPGGSSLLLGKFWGALFLGQMISGSSLARLPRLTIPFLGRFGLQRLVQLGVLGLAALWAYTGLVPGSFLAAAAAAAIGAVLMALAGRLTDRGWVKWAGAGLAFVAVPFLFWGNVPLIFASMLMVGFFYSPALITLQSYFQRNVQDQHMGGVMGAQSSFVTSTISMGFALMSLLASFYAPVLFPGMLLPVLGVFLAVGAGYYLAARGGALPGLSPTSLKPKEP